MRRRRLAGDRRHVSLSERKRRFRPRGRPHGGPSAAAFWLAELDQAVLVLRESELGPKYKERIEQLAPKIRMAARWLAQPRHQASLKHNDADAPNRLLFDALAYGLSGVLTGDDELKQLGRRFVDLAMAQFRQATACFLKKAGPTRAIRPWRL